MESSRNRPWKLVIPNLPTPEKSFSNGLILFRGFWVAFGMCGLSYRIQVPPGIDLAASLLNNWPAKRPRLGLQVSMVSLELANKGSTGETFPEI